MKKTMLFSFLMLLASIGVHAQQRISLAGTWDFAVGDAPSYDDHVTLPGSMLTNGKGDDVSLKTPWTGSLYDSSFYFNPYMKKYQVEGQMKFPFFLTPEKHYVGRAWYQRTVRVPKAWRRHRVTLFLERPHIETTLLVNGREVGHQMSLSTPHQYDVTDFVRFGKRRWEVSKQRLRARIAVRLEKNTQDSAADLPRHRDCTRHLRRVVRVVGVYAVY